MTAASQGTGGTAKIVRRSRAIASQRSIATKSGAIWEASPPGFPTSGSLARCARVRELITGMELQDVVRTCPCPCSWFLSLSRAPKERHADPSLIALFRNTPSAVSRRPRQTRRGAGAPDLDLHQAPKCQQGRSVSLSRDL
jgi:hypothetical protein